MNISIPNKIVYFNLFAISLFLFGCSSTYRVSENYSKLDLYNNFNKSCYGKSIKITLTNDSILIVHRGACISNDTLFLFNDNKNANNTYLLLDKVKTISCNSNWHALLSGVGTGAAAGGIAGLLGATTARDKNGNFDRKVSTLQGVVAGSIIGSVIGLFIGYTNTYEFISNVR